ncbi:MAG TPA: polysaccharide biosynthesis/export family protein [Polyangiales bacterium]|jgi:protein involved in polysaccharide export with SLBB domain|nr:polysaccharide biosynthesis/export family protein [Polyangiales bacterium]
MSPKGASALRLLQLTAALLVLCSGCVATAVSSPDSVPLRDFLARSRGQAAATYRCRVGDLLTTRFFFNPQLDQDTVVRPDGKIALKLVGDVQAEGKRPKDLSAEISRAYAPLFNKSSAVVIVKETTGYRAFTAGQLHNPGQISLVTGAKTVLESLAVSGGVTEEGTLSHVYLIRKLPNEKYPIIAELNLKHALSGEDPSQDVELMPDDFVFVPNSSAANLNLALQQYFFRNLNFSTGVGVGVGLSTSPRRTNNTLNGGRLNTAPSSGAQTPSSTPTVTTPPRTQPPMQTMPITPARP